LLDSERNVLIGIEGRGGIEDGAAGHVTRRDHSDVAHELSRALDAGAFYVAAGHTDGMDARLDCGIKVVFEAAHP